MKSISNYDKQAILKRNLLHLAIFVILNWSLCISELVLSGFSEFEHVLLRYLSSITSTLLALIVITRIQIAYHTVYRIVEIDDSDLFEIHVKHFRFGIPNWKLLAKSASYTEFNGGEPWTYELFFKTEHEAEEYMKTHYPELTKHQIINNLDHGRRI